MSADKVIRSIEAPGGMMCVDLFRRPDRSFGFELYRRDPEDGHGWYPVGFFASRRFDDRDEAFRAAAAAVPWVADAAGSRRAAGHRSAGFSPRSA